MAQIFKKMTYKVETKLPRGTMPPPTKKFVDKKKRANKNWCRGK